ncbi:MAG: NAD-dependent epimerase/dehydratase family protein [Crocinitomicaceae bacterium]|nr:NAD-dependent epimerase/dehydratase family protein [Crocinitomicaceae bacterium]
MIFVTGGTGILGSHLLFNLSETDNSIKALYRTEERLNQVKELFRQYNPNCWETQFSKINWVQGDILDITDLLNLIEGCSYIYHCAGLVSFHPKDFYRVMKINREGTENIVNACLHHNVTKLIHVSSTAAIGGDDKDVITEETKWKNSPNNSAYGVSKYSGEREVWRGIEEGLNAAIVNPCVIFGAGNWNESSLTIFKTVRKGISFYPPGSNASVDVRDVVEIMVLLMKSDIYKERFLVTGSNQSFKELMTVISKELNVKAPTKPVNRVLVNVVRRILAIAKRLIGKRSDITKETVINLFATKSYDNSKVKDAFGFQFRDLKEQVRNTVAGRLD